MACRILMGVEQGCDTAISCLFDSTKQVAFGPIMGDEQEAEAFVEWLADEQGYNDPRRMEKLHSHWYPRFINRYYSERLCKKCDMYNKETTGGICEECK